MDVALHFRSPLEKSPQIFALPPGKFPELQQSDLLHLHAAIGFDPPQQIGTAPGREMVSAGSIPQKPQHVAHSVILNDRCFKSEGDLTRRYS